MKSGLRTPRIVFTALLVAVALGGAVGCEDCVGSQSDAGPDGGDDGPVDSGVRRDAGNDSEDAGAGSDGGGGPLCTPETEGYNQPCSMSGEEPLCGVFLCNPITDELVCADPGPNDCGVCGDLNTDAGQPNQPCGEFLCGVGTCNTAGTAVTCVGDHPRNVCGGCVQLFVDAGPGDVCSECETGRQTCTRDQNQLLCFRGRDALADAGPGVDRCERRILAHAFLDERLGGGFIRQGTLALLEDVGGGTSLNPPEIRVIFDPLIEGSGATGLVRTGIYLATTLDFDPFDFGNPYITLFPYFAQRVNGIGSEPLRTYPVTTSQAANIPDAYPYIVLYDDFLTSVVSAGTWIDGPPANVPEFDGGVRPDAGFTDAGFVDAGDVDAGDAGDADAGDSDAGDLDAGLVDAGT